MSIFHSHNSVNSAVISLIPFIYIYKCIFHVRYCRQNNNNNKEKKTRLFDCQNNIRSSMNSLKNICLKMCKLSLFVLIMNNGPATYLGWYLKLIGWLLLYEPHQHMPYNAFKHSGILLQNNVAFNFIALINNIVEIHGINKYMQMLQSQTLDLFICKIK